MVHLLLNASEELSVSLTPKQAIEIQYHQVPITQFNIQVISHHRLSMFHLFIFVFKEERHAAPQTLRVLLSCQPLSSSYHSLFSFHSQTSASLTGTTSAPIPWLFSPPPTAARHVCPSIALELIPLRDYNDTKAHVSCLMLADLTS